MWGGNKTGWLWRVPAGRAGCRAVRAELRRVFELRSKGESSGHSPAAVRRLVLGSPLWRGLLVLGVREAELRG